MNTNLMTPDGFPRADLDVAQSEHIHHHQLSAFLIFICSTDNTLADNTFEK